MDNIVMTWIDSINIKDEHLDIPIRQVYVWVVTSDEHIVIVSKDDKKWQFPGGKPESNETLIETARREVSEETNVDIQKYSKTTMFFGYYIVEDKNTGTKVIQVRMFCRIQESSTQLNLTADNEDTHQKSAEIVKYVRAPSLNELVKLIPWLEDTGEFKSVMQKDLLRVG